MLQAVGKGTIGRETDLAMQLLFVLRETVYGQQEVKGSEKLCFLKLHSAFMKAYPNQEHDVVTWAFKYRGAVPILSTISQKIVAWYWAQQPGQQLPIPGANAASQSQLQVDQARTSLTCLLLAVHV